MKYLIWGTGEYCEEKLNWSKELSVDIVGFVDRQEIEFMGKTTITPDKISEQEFDRIMIMSTYFPEIAKDIVSLGIPSEKIELAVNLRPFIGDELVLMPLEPEVSVLEDGSIKFLYKKGFDKNLIFEANEKKDLEELKRLVNKTGNVEKIKALDVYPTGRLFGHDRGGSICRYYIEKFLEKNRECIRGKVLEVGGNEYTLKYGEPKHTESKVLIYTNEVGKQNVEDEVFVYGDLETGVNIKAESYDGMILTQVLDFIFDVHATADNIKKGLVKGGVALLTVSGITPISRSDMDRYGHFWSFTSESIRRLFESEGFKVNIETFGNCKTACGFLQGMSYKDFSEEELNVCDDDYVVLIGARIEKIA